MTHLFTAPKQPATRFVDHTFGRGHSFRFNERKMFRCYCCGRLRWAKNLLVQVFYDGWRFWCKEGCKTGRKKGKQ